MIGLHTGGESNPGLPRGRRGYSPLYYRGHLSMKIEIQGCFRLGNLDFDFKIRTSDFLIKREIQKRISTSWNPFQLRPLNWNPSWKRISVHRNPFLDFAFYWEIRNPKSKSRFPNWEHPIDPNCFSSILWRTSWQKFSLFTAERIFITSDHDK